MTFTTSGGSGDLDMYVKAGSAPTTSSYDCRPYESGNNEVCSIDNPAAGTYYVMLRGYSSYNNASLLGELTTSGGSTGEGGGGSVTDISASSGQWKHYTLEVPAGMSTLDIDMSGGTGDGDLFVRFGSQPTSSSYDCRPYKSGNNESCSFSNPQAGTWHISINAYQTFSGVTLNAQYNP